MKTLTTLITLLSLLAFAGCGSSDNQTDSQTARETQGTEGLPVIDQWLIITDSIGVELGDSNFVFGQIVSAQFLPDGNIAIADMQKNKISIFSVEGEFLNTVGRNGSGPGEFLMLTNFAVKEDGSFIVPDAMGGKLNFYDPEYNFTEVFTGFFPSPPIMISPVENGFIGLKPEFEQTDEEMNVGMGIYLWTDSSAYDHEYIKNMILFDMNDLGGSVETMVFFDTDNQDNLITTPYSTSEYVITSQNLSGEQNWQIVEDFPRVRKTDEEIQEEHEMLLTRIEASGTPAEMADNFQIEEYKVFINQLEVDNKDRLWVLTGFYDIPVYRVYDCVTGDFLFTAALRTDENHENIVPSINRYGIAGLDPESEDWPRVYIISSEDSSLFQ